MIFLKRLGKTLTNNIWLKVLALVLAFVLWVLVAQINNPVRTLTYNNVKVTLVGTDVLDAEGKVYQVLDNTDTAKVTVRAPESIISSITAADISAVAENLVGHLTKVFVEDFDELVWSFITIHTANAFAES